MHSTRFHRSRAALVALAAAAAVAATSAAATRHRDAGPALQPAPAALPDTLAFDVEYTGIGAEGVDLIWRGNAAGAVPAQVTIRMEYAGRREDRAMPVWPVNAWLFYCADDDRRSFAAELTGSMNWRTGEMLVTGLVSAGQRQDAPVEQRVQLRRPGLGGAARVVFQPRVALGDAVAMAF